MKSLPLVGITACSKTSAALPFQMVGLKYIEAIAYGSEALPVLIPALGAEALDVPSLLSRLDGVFLTGSPSNVHPQRYDKPLGFPDSLLDTARDETTHALIHGALKHGIPLLAVCRGFQELNVALGGSLHQFVHQQAGLHDHRSDDADPVDRQYAPVHPVTLTEGGVLQKLLGGQTRIQVNSLHSQGIDRLAAGLSVEARADDGLIEAVRVTDALGFAMAVQWHPEWKVRENPDALPIFRAFGAACRTRQSVRSAR